MGNIVVTFVPPTGQRTPPINPTATFSSYPNGVYGNMSSTRIGPSFGADYSGIALDGNKMSAIPGGVRIVDYKETWSMDNVSSTIVYDVPWQIRKLFVDWALGYSYLSASSPTANAVLHRVVPAQNPSFPWQYATDCQLVNGIGAMGLDPNVNDGAGNLLPMIAYFDNGNVDVYGLARYAVTYRAVDYTVRTDSEIATNSMTELARFVSRSSTYAVQSLPLNGTAYFTQGPAANLPVAGSINRVIPTRSITYRLLNWPQVPVAGYEACEGKINAAAFDVPQTMGGANVDGYTSGGSAPVNGYAPGTLLMQSPKTTRHRNAAGRVMFDIEISFLYRAGGWNNFLASDGNYYPVIVKPSQSGLASAPPYQTADFNQIFNFGPLTLYQGPNG